jgi:hypothetical protein
MKAKASKPRTEKAQAASDQAWEKNRLKPGALFYITVDGQRQPIRYPTRRGKLPLRTIREMVDTMVSLRQKAS